eukprot:1309743-Pleurochrysis_carterae.AAC.1
MAMIVITASQPSTDVRINGAYRAVKDSLRALGRGLARAAEVRRHLPHGFTMCSALFILMALITRGDAAFNDHFAHVR